MEQTIYRAFSDYLKDRYGEKVYKLPIALPVTCPNRDGTCGNGGAGCTFCGEIGTGYENLPASMTITEQMDANKAHIVPKYKAKELQEMLGLKATAGLKRNYIEPAMRQGLIAMTIPDKPTSRNQRYYRIK